LRREQRDSRVASTFGLTLNGTDNATSSAADPIAYALQALPGQLHANRGGVDG